MSALTALLQETATAYTELTHAPYDVDVIGAYAQLKGELWQQFTALDIAVEFTAVDPYRDSAGMFRMIDTERRVLVFTGGDLPLTHPFSAQAPNGQTFNAIFRAVHDAVAHYPERNTFSLRGEFAAFRAHARTLTMTSVMALATETIGQNAYYNYGPNARTFAPQKAGLLPFHLVYNALTLEV